MSKATRAQAALVPEELMKATAEAVNATAAVAQRAPKEAQTTEQQLEKSRTVTVAARDQTRDWLKKLVGAQAKQAGGKAKGRAAETVANAELRRVTTNLEHSRFEFSEG